MPQSVQGLLTHPEASGFLGLQQLPQPLKPAAFASLESRWAGHSRPQRTYLGLVPLPLPLRPRQVAFNVGRPAVAHVARG